MGRATPFVLELSCFFLLIYYCRKRRSCCQPKISLECKIEIFLAWKNWRETLQPPIDTQKLHPDLKQLLVLEDDCVSNNQPPEIFESLTISTRQILSGITPTISTIKGQFLPKRSNLIETFQAHRPFSKLTEGGKAFTKHFHRSRGGWWGQAKGSPEQINEMALRKVNEILDRANWRNIFYLPGEQPVCEYRVILGYGARWSWDLTTSQCKAFRGFLEPPQEDGHEKGWIH